MQLPLSPPVLSAPPRPAPKGASPLVKGLALFAACRKGVVCYQRGPKKLEAAPKVSSYQQFLAKLKKKFGDEAFVDQSQSRARVETFSTGPLSLDLALGGGLPYGRFVEIFGPEQSGKTTLALSCCVSLQASGRRQRCAYIDVEHTLDLTYAQEMGLDLAEEKWILTQPQTAEEALDFAHDCICGGQFDLVVIDSVAALLPQEEADKDMTENSMALRARLLSKFTRKAAPVADDKKTTVLCINQLRANIGGYGLSEDTVGGKALKYTASVRLEVRSPQSGKIGSAEQPTGIQSKVTAKKNKCYPPYRTAEYDVIFGKGISAVSSMVDCGVKLGFVEKKGAWFVFKDVKIQGSANLAKHLEQNEKDREELEQLIRGSIGGASEEMDLEPKADADKADLKSKAKKSKGLEDVEELAVAPNA